MTPASGSGCSPATTWTTWGCLRSSRGCGTRWATGPVYLSIDIDVLDPAFAPATGTPETAGLNTRELVRLVRGFDGARLVGADIVEVAPAYDHAEITGVAAANLAYELISLFARNPVGR